MSIVEIVEIVALAIVGLAGLGAMLFLLGLLFAEPTDKGLRLSAPWNHPIRKRPRAKQHSPESR